MRLEQDAEQFHIHDQLPIAKRLRWIARQSTSANDPWTGDEIDASWRYHLAAESHIVDAAEAEKLVRIPTDHLFDQESRRLCTTFDHQNAWHQRLAWDVATGPPRIRRPILVANHVLTCRIEVTDAVEELKVVAVRHEFAQFCLSNNVA